MSCDGARKSLVRSEVSALRKLVESQQRSLRRLEQRTKKATKELYRTKSGAVRAVLPLAPSASPRKPWSLDDKKKEAQVDDDGVDDDDADDDDACAEEDDDACAEDDDDVGEDDDDDDATTACVREGGRDEEERSKDLLSLDIAGRDGDGASPCPGNNSDKINGEENAERKSGSYARSKRSVFRREHVSRGRSMVTLREAFPENLEQRDEDNIDAGDERLFRLFCDVKEGITQPSIFLIKALAIARNSWQLDCLALLVFFFQAWFPTWFACVVLHRSNFTMIAPGFHNKVSGSLRARWLHRFSIDVSSFCFLCYIAWSTWQQRQLHIFRFYLRADGSRIRHGILVMGMFTNVVAIFSVVFLTYLLFRIEPDIHEILLNAVALDFIHKFDQTVCSTFLHHTQLHLLLRSAKSELIDEADRIIHRGALGEIAALKKTSTRDLFSAPRTWQKFDEFVLRYVRRAYILASSSLLVFAITGGHVGHTHFVNVLWYFHLVKSRVSSSESTTRLKFLVRENGKDPDSKFAFVALFVTAIVLLIVFTVGKLAIYFFYGPQDDVLWFKKVHPIASQRKRALQFTLRSSSFSNSFRRANSSRIFMRKRRPSLASTSSDESISCDSPPASPRTNSSPGKQAKTARFSSSSSRTHSGDPTDLEAGTTVDGGAADDDSHSRGDTGVVVENHRLASNPFRQFFTNDKLFF